MGASESRTSRRHPEQVCLLQTLRGFSLHPPFRSAKLLQHFRNSLENSLFMPHQASNLTIRRARLTDSPAVAELSAQLGYPTPENEMADRLAHLIRHPRFGAVLI